MEGVQPITLIAPELQTGNAQTDSYGDPVTATPAEYPRMANRQKPSPGTEVIKAETQLAIGGTITWTVRKDDELSGTTDPTVRLNTDWQLRDDRTGDVYEIFAVEELRHHGTGESRYRIHTKLSVT